MKVSYFKIILIALFPIIGFAQTNSSSPYSAFGLGEDAYNGAAESVNMGGLNNIYWDNIHVNVKNPATYSFLNITNFSFGAQGRSATMETKDNIESSGHFGVSHLIIGIPMGKWGAAIGFMPTSSTGYDVNYNHAITDPNLAIYNGNNMVYDGTYNNSYKFKGFGGMNRFFVGTSYSPFTGFSAGVNINYDFGNLSRNTRMYTLPVYKKIEDDGEEVPVFEGSQYGSKEDEAIRIRSFDFEFGLIYTGNFSEKLQYTVGATYGLGNKTTLEYEKYLYTFKFDSQGREVPIDTVGTSINYINNEVELPQSGGMGLSIGEYSKWMIGVNYEFKDPTNLTFGLEDLGVTFSRNQKYSIGGYWTPKYNSLMSYLARVTYRAGFKYEELGLRFNGVDIVDYSINFGVGLPVKGGFTNINIGGALGTRGTVDSGLIKENYINFIINFSLGDKWFKKVRYN